MFRLFRILALCSVFLTCEDASSQLFDNYLSETDRFKQANKEIILLSRSPLGLLYDCSQANFFAGSIYYDSSSEAENFSSQEFELRLSVNHMYLSSIFGQAAEMSLNADGSISDNGRTKFSDYFLNENSVPSEKLPKLNKKIEECNTLYANTHKILRATMPSKEKSKDEPK